MSTANKNDPELIPVTVADHLEEDPPIRGQNFACMSFVSPNDALASKDAFAARMFLGQVAKDITEMFNNLEITFADSKAAPYVKETMRLLRDRHEFLWNEGSAQEEFSLWRTQKSHEIDRLFHAEHGNFTTSVQGFKIRGVYDSEEAARNRAKTIQRIDPKFHVYIAHVGVWCPWSPSIEDLEDSEYATTQLNTLVKKYDDSQQLKNDIYNKRKDASVQRMNVEREVWLERIKAEVTAREKERQENEAKSASERLGNSGNVTSGAEDGSSSSAPPLPIRDDLMFHGTSLSSLLSVVKDQVDKIDSVAEELVTKMDVIEEKIESVAEEMATISMLTSTME